MVIRTSRKTAVKDLDRARYQEFVDFFVKSYQESLTKELEKFSAVRKRGVVKEKLRHLLQVVSGGDFEESLGFGFLLHDEVARHRFYNHLSRIHREAPIDYSFMRSSIDGRMAKAPTEGTIIPEVYAGAASAYYDWLETLYENMANPAVERSYSIIQYHALKVYYMGYEVPRNPDEITAFMRRHDIRFEGKPVSLYNYFERLRKKQSRTSPSTNYSNRTRLKMMEDLMQEFKSPKLIEKVRQDHAALLHNIEKSR